MIVFMTKNEQAKKKAVCMYKSREKRRQRGKETVEKVDVAGSWTKFYYRNAYS